MMKFFLDSAKLDEIERAWDNFAIDGITTNPKHVKNSGKSFKTVINELSGWAKKVLPGGDHFDFPISVELDPHINDTKRFLADAREIRELSPFFVIKIPCIPSGLRAVAELEKDEIPVNVTLVFTPMQALLAARAQATFVSPFVGWRESHGENGIGYLSEIVKILENYDFCTEILVAALRNARQIELAAIAGADIVTCGLAVFDDGVINPFTDLGLQRFQDSWDATPKD